MIGSLNENVKNVGWVKEVNKTLKVGNDFRDLLLANKTKD